MTLEVQWTTKFKKDYKKLIKRRLDISKLDKVVTDLANRIQLEAKYQDHPLSGNYEGFRECHIQPDWLLIYTIIESKLILTLSRTGTHSDLFN